MTAQKGKDLLLKLDDGSGAFVSVDGLRTRRLTFNAETVDFSDSDSSCQWR
jgi:TP901-1 family phage major tail protein